MVQRYGRERGNVYDALCGKQSTFSEWCEERSHPSSMLTAPRGWSSRSRLRKVLPMPMVPKWDLIMHGNGCPETHDENVRVRRRASGVGAAVKGSHDVHD